MMSNGDITAAPLTSEGEPDLFSRDEEVGEKLVVVAETLAVVEALVVAVDVASDGRLKCGNDDGRVGRVANTQRVDDAVPADRPGTSLARSRGTTSLCSGDDPAA